jgi:hypothetical protein
LTRHCCVGPATIGALALVLLPDPGFAQESPLRFHWDAPPNCPREAAVLDRIRLLSDSASGRTKESLLRAEGRIEALRDRFRLTLAIHYGQVNGTRVIDSTSCEDLGGAAAVALSLLVRVERTSSAPLTEGDLHGSPGVAVQTSQPSGTAGAPTPQPSTAAAGGTPQPAVVPAAPTPQQPSTLPTAQTAHPSTIPRAAASPSPPVDGRSARPAERSPSPREGPSAPAARWHLSLRAPTLNADVGALPHLSYGVGLAAGFRYDAVRVSLAGTLWR